MSKKGLKTVFWLAVMLAAVLTQASAPLPPGRPGALIVTQTVQTGYIRTTNWSIALSADPTTWTLYFQDQGVSYYTIRLQKAGMTDSDWTVSGEIRIQNPTSIPATVAGVTEMILPGPRRAAVNCPVDLPVSLQPGETMTCAYSAKLPKAVRGISLGLVRTQGRVMGGTASAVFKFGAPSSIANPLATVSAGGTTYGPFNHSVLLQFERVYSCLDSSAPQTEMAVIVETGQTSQASVQIDCPISPGFQYEKTTHTFQDAGGWAVEGTVDLQQATGRDMWVANVREFLDPGPELVVSCDHDFASGAFQMPAGVVLHCSFQGSVPDTSQRYIYSRFTFEISRWYPDGSRIPAGTWDGFDDPTPLIFNP